MGVVLGRIRRFDELPSMMKGRADDVSFGVTRIVKVAARAIHRSVVTETPVDTGTARSNWIVSKNAPIKSVIPAHVPYPKRSGKNRSEKANKQATIALGRGPINSYVDGKDRRILIQNNVPYIGRLDGGSSPQNPPPANFARKSVQVGIAAIRNIKVIKR